MVFGACFSCRFLSPQCYGRLWGRYCTSKIDLVAIVLHVRSEPSKPTQMPDTYTRIMTGLRAQGACRPVENGRETLPCSCGEKKADWRVARFPCISSSHIYIGVGWPGRCFPDRERNLRSFFGLRNCRLSTLVLVL